MCADRARPPVVRRPARGGEAAVSRGRRWGAARASIEAPLPRRTLAAILGLLVAWRAAIALFSALAARQGGFAPCYSGVGFLGHSACWDSAWYLRIVAEGYTYTPGAASSIAFFPLFPLLIGLFDRFLPGGDVLAGLVVVHLALAGAAVYIYQIVRLDFGDRVAWRTLWFLLLFPGAIFFSFVYTESLALLGLAGALYHARRGEWLRAGLWGAAAGATKLTALMLPLPLVAELLARGPVAWRRPRPWLGIALAPLGGLAYFAYLQARFGDFRVFFETQAQWERHGPGATPVFLLGLRWLGGDRSALDFYPGGITSVPDFFLLLDTSLLLLFVTAGIVLWWRVRASYGVLVLALLAPPALSGNPQSLTRYLAILFPAFILLALIESRPARYALSLVSLLGFAFLLRMFLRALWAG